MNLKKHYLDGNILSRETGYRCRRTDNTLQGASVRPLGKISMPLLQIPDLRTLFRSSKANSTIDGLYR